MSSLENRSHQINNSRGIPVANDATAFFPNSKHSLNQSSMQHKASIRPHTGLGMQSTEMDQSRMLSSIEHVRSGEDHAVNNIYYSQCYSPEHELDPQQMVQAEEQESPDYRPQYREEGNTPGEMNILLNDTNDIERSYEKLTAQYREQQQRINEAESYPLSHEKRQPVQEYTRPDFRKNYRRTSESSDTHSPTHNKKLHTREISFQQINRGAVVTSHPERLMTNDDRFHSMSPDRQKPTV
jgi:hypothetical protein